MSAALALDQPRLAQLGDQVLDIGEGEALGLGDGAQRNRSAVLLATQLDHQAHSDLARVENSIAGKS